MTQSLQIWSDFKTHFEASHSILKTKHGQIIKSSSFHQANILAEQVRTEMENIQTNVLQALEEQTQENQKIYASYTSCKQGTNRCMYTDDDNATDHARRNKIPKVDK